MKIKCPICQEEIESGLEKSLLEGVMNEIKRQHPEWVEANGACNKCVSFYLQQIEGHGGHA
ncbi:MAG TPA: hypothetical protein VGB26_00540 [Nitrospiria bacterium]|jgi:uncharacterized protein with PIN domain